MLLLAFLLSCNDHIINEVKQPEIIVAPTTLEFGHLLSGHESRVRTVTIANGGSADLVVDRISVSGDNYTADESGFVVESGGYYQIEITYEPKTYEHNEGYLDIYLEGDEAPSEGVWLNGNGDAPVINVSPLELDFGEPLLGCEPSQEITIDNSGNIDLIVTEIDFMSTIPQEIALSFGTLPEFPWIIPPSTRLSFYVDYTPTDEADDMLDYEILSNDPLHPVVDTSAIGSAVLSNETVQRWIQQNQLVVDIIWIIDNSGSMASVQSALGINMNMFMSSFLQYYPDFQMAFITTDSPLFSGSTITNTTVDPVGVAHDTIDAIGTRGNGNEKGAAMLKDCLEIGDCSNWIRPNAALVAIFVSDEYDSSPLPWTDYVASYDAIKPNMFTAYGIIGDVPGGCIAPNGRRIIAGMGYYEIIDHYLGQWWSICNEDWGDQMEEIAELISIQTNFPLDHDDPVVDTIVVWINGQQTERGWIYDPNSNSVLFDGVDAAPSPGDTLEITYSTWGCSGE